LKHSPFWKGRCWRGCHLLCAAVSFYFWEV